MASYRLSAGARNDILVVFFTGLEMFGYQQAEEYQKGLVRAFELLSDYPRMARVREEIRDAVRALPHKAHIIVYELDDAGNVVILRVRHGHEDWTGETY